MLRELIGIFFSDLSFVHKVTCVTRTALHDAEAMFTRLAGGVYASLVSSPLVTHLQPLLVSLALHTVLSSLLKLPLATGQRPAEHL